MKRRARGDGSVYKDDKRNRWVAQIVLPDGQRRSKTGQTQKEVLNWLTEQRNKIQKGTYVIDDKLRVSEYLYHYLETVARHNVRPRTFSTYKGYSVNHIIPELGKIKLDSLRPDQVQAFYNKSLDGGLSRRSVEQMHAILHKALDQALRWGLVSRNVCDLVNAPRPKRTPPKIWNSKEVNIFLKASEGSVYYPIYILAVYTGMRQSEILGIHKEDISGGVINIGHSVQRIAGEGLVISSVKSDKSRRPVVLPPTARSVLNEHLKSVKSGLIFTTVRGNPVDARELVRHFKKVIEDTGLPDIRFHDLRHFHASALLAAGVNPKVVQERLGHSSIVITLDIYSHLIPSLQKDAADKFEGIINN